MNEKKDKSTLIISILIPLAAGSLSAFFAGDMARYADLDRPPFSPPGWLFPLVWTALYILMGISAWLAAQENSPGKKRALLLYAFQLFLNFCWSIFFFRFSLYFLAFLWLLLLIAAIAAMIKQFYQIVPAAAYLQIPYFLWCCFAAYLNYGIFLRNGWA